ncbi:MAG: alanine racemase [Clostridia bacterium]|nr:alanine racemase [Clostridia bacterium]
MNALIIETDKLRANIETIKQTVGVRVIGVLKGNGYGLDIVKFAEVLRDCGIDMFAVCELWEARALRECGFEEEILLMRSTAIESEVREILELGLTATIGSNEAAVMLNGVAKDAGETVPAHIELDTGFGRYGFGSADLEKVENIARFLENIELTGVYTHFSNAFGDKQSTEVQLESFLSMLSIMEGDGLTFPMRHAANSCAALRFENTRLDAVRIGSAFLGRLPIRNDWGLYKIGYLSGDITEIRWLEPGQNVGYANVFKVKKPTRTAVVPVGYIDGFCMEKSKDTFRGSDVWRYMFGDFKRFFVNKKLYAEINEKRARVLGRVCMCNVVLDVTKINCAVGDSVIFQVNPLFVDSGVLRLYIGDEEDSGEEKKGFIRRFLPLFTKKDKREDEEYGDEDTEEINEDEEDEAAEALDVNEGASGDADDKDEDIR